MDRTNPELVEDAIQRLVAYTDQMTYFGENSVNLAIAKLSADQASIAYDQRRGLIRRFSILASRGDDLDKAIEEQGGNRRRGAQRARLLAVIRPFSADVLGIVGSDIEIPDADADPFEAGDTLRIRNEDASVTEIATIAAKGTAGAGPNGGTVLSCVGVANAYSPSTEDVRVLLRHSIAAGTEIDTRSGIKYQTLDDVLIGDANPVMDGESVALSLADKVWCEAVERGERGSVDANSITGLVVADPKVSSVFNPERSIGGEDQETDFAAKRRTTQAAQRGAQETRAWFEALAQRGHRNVLRLFVEESSSVSTIRGLVVSRNGAGGLSVDVRAALATYIEDRIRSGYSVEIENVVLTAIEIEATITLEPGRGTPRRRLRRAWRSAADGVATFLDWRKWAEGTSVDEADLLGIVRDADGVASLVTSTFLPAADVEISTTSLPIFTRLSLTDSVSGLVLQADLTQEF